MLALDQQPNVVTGKYGGYYFLPMVMQKWFTLGLQEKPVAEWTQEERKQIKQSYQDCFDKFEQDVEMAETEGKILFVKEHSCFLSDPVAESRFLSNDSTQEAPWTVSVPGKYGGKTTHSERNETVLPDEFLLTWLPTFLIRHPALVFPSRYRAVFDLNDKEAAKMEELHFGLSMTLHWTRTLYEWYSQHLSKSEGEIDSDGVSWPLILDADDVISEPAVVYRFSEIVGLDPTKLQFSWSPATEEELAKVDNYFELRMRSTILASAGVLPGKTAKDLDIDVEAKKWREEFGEDEGKRMEKWVRAAMPDYEFMKARRLRPEMCK